MTKLQFIIFVNVLFFAALIGIIYWRLSYIQDHISFVCSNCENKVKVGKYKVIITPHFFSKLYLKCPYCNRRSWMNPERD